MNHEAINRTCITDQESQNNIPYAHFATMVHREVTFMFLCSKFQNHFGLVRRIAESTHYRIIRSSSTTINYNITPVRKSCRQEKYDRLVLMNIYLYRSLRIVSGFKYVYKRSSLQAGLGHFVYMCIQTG